MPRTPPPPGRSGVPPRRGASRGPALGGLGALAAAILIAAAAGPAHAACQEQLARLKPNEVVAERRAARVIEISTREMQEVVGPLATRGDPTDRVVLGTGALRRSVPVLWRAKLPRGADIDRMQVIYLVRPGRSSDGLAQRVGPGGGGADAVPIAFEADRPVELCREGGWKLVQGGARVAMEVGALPAAGRYRARLRVRLRDW